MALTGNQKSSRLFKKTLGVAETITTREFFSELKLGNYAVLPNQIWSQADQIPFTAAIVSGITQKFELLELSWITGSVSGSPSRDVSYFSEYLKNAIPSNFNSGASYYISLWENDGTTPINDGEGDWMVDTTAGVVTFYTPTSTMSDNVSRTTPPKISFYKYIGNIGLTSSGVTDNLTSLSTVISGEISNRLSGDTSLSTLISTETSNRNSGITSLSTALSIVISGNTYDDSSLSTRISTEISDRLSGDTSLSTLISIESSNRTSGDASLSTSIITTNGTILYMTSGITGNTSLGILSSGVTLGMIYITNTGSSTANVNIGTTSGGTEINPYGILIIESGEVASVTVNRRLSNTINSNLYVNSLSWSNVNLTIQWTIIWYSW